MVMSVILRRWLCTQEDLAAMYEFMSQNNKTEVCLWCDGYCNDNNLQVKGCECSCFYRAEKENEVDDVASELQELHSSDHGYSDPQYRLVARVIIIPPCKHHHKFHWSLHNTHLSTKEICWGDSCKHPNTVTAVLKAMNSQSTQGGSTMPVQSTAMQTQRAAAELNFRFMVLITSLSRCNVV